MPPPSRHIFDLVRYRVFADLKSDSSKSYLGVIWWLLDPLLYLVIFYLLFEVFLKRGGEGFVGFLLCGLVFWRWFDTSVKKAAMSIQSNSGTINQVYIPKLLFPITDIFTSTYRFVFILGLLLVFMILYTGGLSMSWLALPAIILTQMVFIFAVGICFALCVPFLPDIKKILDSFMLMLFYMSGIIFDISRLSEQTQQILSINPMVVLIKYYRGVFLHGEWPDWIGLSRIAIVSLLVLLACLYAGKKLDLYYPRIIR